MGDSEIRGRANTKFTNVNVPMKAKRIKNPIAKVERKAGCAGVRATQ